MSGLYTEKLTRGILVESAPEERVAPRGHVLHETPVICRDPGRRYKLKSAMLDFMPDR